METYIINARSALKPNDSIAIDGKIYVIQGVRGYGSSCIVYDADTEDGCHFLLKEFYPTKMGIVRNTDQTLNIPESHIKQFQNRKN